MAVPQPQQQVRSYKIFPDNSGHIKCFYLNTLYAYFTVKLQFQKHCSSVQENISVDHIGCAMAHLFPQVLLLVLALVRIVHSSTQMARVCAELVSSSIMNWISKALPLTVNWTASLRSVLYSGYSLLYRPVENTALI